MRYSCIALLLFVPSLVRAEPAPNVRPTDPLSQQTLARALERSAIVRALVADLQATNVIVHIDTGMLPAGIGGTTRFVASRAGHRYLRVTMASSLRGDLRVILLAHELEHAREIAQSSAADLAGLFRLFEGRGFRNGHRSYETMSALRVERRIRQELEAEPVIELHHEHLRAAGAKTAAEVPKR